MWTWTPDWSGCTSWLLRSLVWTLLRPDNEAVFEDESLCDTNSPSDKEVTLPQAGDYRLIVSGSDAATGTYRIKTQSR
jgi:hypothetical protein